MSTSSQTKRCACGLPLTGRSKRCKECDAERKRVARLAAKNTRTRKVPLDAGNDADDVDDVYPTLRRPELRLSVGKVRNVSVAKLQGLADGVPAYLVVVEHSADARGTDYHLGPFTHKDEADFRADVVMGGRPTWDRECLVAAPTCESYRVIPPSLRSCPSSCGMCAELTAVEA